MNNIKEYNFSDLYEMGSGISSKPEQAGHGAPFVSFSTVFNNYFLPEKVKDLMDTSEEEQEVYSLKEGDILLTRTSETIDELGMSCVVLKDYPRATFSGFVKRLRPTQPDVTYPKFMGFYLRSKFFRKTMTNNAVLTLRASLNEDIFSYLKLYLPDYETQKKIGDFLYSLIAKIGLNNRINVELEAMAKTIYDYWFVQFDYPISKEQAKAMGKPKLEGKPYKSSGGKMMWSEELKRDIPDGWEVKCLGEYASVKKGQLITAETSQPGKVKVVAAGVDFSYHHSESNVERNTITVSGSGANAGYVNFWREPIFASDCIVVRGHSDVETLLVYHFLKLMQNFIFRQAKGSAQPHVYPSDINSLKYPIAPKYLIEKFGSMTLSANEKITLYLQENQKLSELRDWLLPMLMNGQVRINETAQSKVVKPVLSETKPANQYFYQTQLVAAIINASKRNKINHGEMTLAKYTYLLDKIYGVPTYFKFDRWHLGPYPKEMKKVVNNRKFFKIQNNEVAVVPQKKEYNYQFQLKVENAIAELASIFKEYSGKERSRQTELIATVCKVIEDIQSTDLKAVRESMKKWSIRLDGEKFKNKAEKFSINETQAALELISKRGWEHLLYSS